MKKIIVEREEGVAEIIDRMLGEEDEELAVVIPRGSTLARSASNFHLLKREADAAGKSVSVESVDDNILAFAKESGLEASHPLWRGAVQGGSGGISDIVSGAIDESRDVKGSAHKAKAPARRRKSAEEKPIKLRVPSEEEQGEREESAEGKPMEEADGGVTEIHEHTEEDTLMRIEEEDRETEAKEDRFLGVGNFFKRKPPVKSRPAEEEEDDDMPEDEDFGSGAGRKKALWIGGGIVAGLLIIGWAVTYFFGRATIVIDFKKNPWTYQDVFAADKSVSQAVAATNTFPAQIFTTQKNTTQSFPASGSANVSVRAQGTITIFNAYSSAKQELVATTRFVTPDGKIFRLASNVVVPGASVTNGQIVPSSIDALIAADQPGPAYNLGPVDKLTIPGFQGTPKYDAFYGKISGTTSGGFAGARAVPTAADVASAKAKVTSMLQSSLSSDLTTAYPNNFKILDGATSVNVTKLTVSTSTDANGNFAVFGQAALQAIGFDESAFKDVLLNFAQSTEASSVFKTVDITYSSIQPDFANGRIKFTAAVSATLEPAFSPDDFKAKVAGESINVARLAIAALPDLQDGKISVWPMWLWSIPSNPNKIIVTAD